MFVKMLRYDDEKLDQGEARLTVLLLGCLKPLAEPLEHVALLYVWASHRSLTHEFGPGFLGLDTPDEKLPRKIFWRAVIRSQQTQ